jgi:hypothetical protein
MVHACMREFERWLGPNYYARAGMLTALIEGIKKKSMKLSHLDFLFCSIKSSLDVFLSFLQIALPSDDIKWTRAFKIRAQKKELKPQPRFLFSLSLFKASLEMLMM